MTTLTSPETTTFPQVSTVQDRLIAAITRISAGPEQRRRVGGAGRSDDELAAYQRVIDDYGQHPALREQVARALEALQETDTA